jgi:intracellular sulfur oxidation DsrE/DsrF family protein
MQNRRDFLLATSALTTLVACSTEQRTDASSSPGKATVAFDERHFNEVASKNVRYRHCFGIPRIASGDGLYAMNNTYAAYDQVLNTPLDQVLLVGVLYLGAPITMAFNDEAWNSLLIPALPHLGEDARVQFESVSITRGNPFLYRPPGSNGTDASIESLVARGARFFVCNNSALQLADLIGKALNRDPKDVYATIVRSLVPGASLVPAGVWAINALQTSHFTYLQAAL